MSETSTALKQAAGEKEQLQASEGNSADVSRKQSFSFDDRPHDRNIARRTRSSWIPSLYLGSGIIRDIRARAPYYASDWKDAWNYRVIPAIVLIFFAKYVTHITSFLLQYDLTRTSVLPGIAFSLDLIETTQQYGVSEVLLSSFMAAFIFSVFGAQPLCVAGVTGPITVLNKTIFDIIERQSNPPNYLQFVGWVYLWGAILHWITAALNCE